MLYQSQFTVRKKIKILIVCRSVSLQ